LGKSQILVINRGRGLGSGPHTSTQIFWEYPPGPPPHEIYEKSPISNLKYPLAPHPSQLAFIMFIFPGERAELIAFPKFGEEENMNISREFWDKFERTKNISTMIKWIFDQRL